PRFAVTGYCQGSPLRAEIESRGSPGLQEAMSRGVQALAKRFGNGPIEGNIQAIVVTVEK
ncbi:MAG TPA: SAM-dependent methyltransferase, partial [Ramlibacter sp.]|nr:SAM-dependent methyltransferase [Ramlibacter sp.]